MDLLKAVQEAPRYDGSNWYQHQEAYFILLNEKGYTPKAAVAFIGDYLGLNDSDRKKFGSSASHWKNPKKK